MAGVKVAMIGVGNVGTTFAQGLRYYSDANRKVGLWHTRVAGLKPSDVKIVAAFDIDPSKTGKRLLELLPHMSSSKPVIDSQLLIHPGLLAEGDLVSLADPVKSDIEEFSKVLNKSSADIVLNLISSGLEKTSVLYSKLSLKAGMSFANATPSKVARNNSLAKAYSRKNLILAGDDLLSQLGGTAFHKGMIDFMVERGVHVKRSYQLDVGGSEETKRTMDERIRMAKRALKTESIGIEAPYTFESVAGTTEYTDFLGDSRNSYYWMSSSGFMGSEVIMDLTLRTNDSANAGNVLLDIARSMKRSAARHSEVISAYGFKNPPKTVGIREAYRKFARLYT